MELGKLQSREAEARAELVGSQHQSFIPGISGVVRPRPRLRSPPNTAHPALRWPQGKSSIRNPFFPPEGSHRLRPSLPFGAPRVPQLQGLSTAPKRRPARPGRWSPALSGSPLHLTGGQSHRPWVRDEPVPPRVSGQSPARPVGSGFARSCPAPGAPVSLRPLPQLPVPGGRERARWARLAPPSPSGPGDEGGGEGGSRAARPARASRCCGSVPAPGDAAPPPPRFRGRESRSVPAGLGAPAGRGGGAAGEPRAGPAHSGGAVAQPALGAAIPSPTEDRPLSTHPDPGRRRRASERRPASAAPAPARSLPRPEARRRRPAAAARPGLGSEPPRPSPEGRPLPRPLPPPRQPRRASPPPRAPPPPPRRLPRTRGRSPGSPAGCGASRGPPGSRSGAAAAARFLRSPPPYWYL